MAGGAYFTRHCWMESEIQVLEQVLSAKGFEDHYPSLGNRLQSL